MAALLVLAAFLLLGVAPVHAAPGDLDPSFGAGGKQTTDLGAADVAAGVAVQPDGGILVAGTSGGDFALARFRADGSLDWARLTDLGGYDRAESLVLQPDGGIVVAGASGGDFALVRYRPDGSLDAGFGVPRIDFDEGYDEAADVLLQPDGKIVVAGSSLNWAYDFALARLHPDGSLDAGFAGDGTLVLDFGSDDAAAAIALAPGGEIVTAGQTGSDFWGGFDFALARLAPDGSLDPGFGLQATDFGRDESVTDVALQPDGGIVAVGYGGPGGYDFALARYRSDGSLDPSFSDDGKALTHFHAFDGASAVALDADGTIVAAGHAGRGPGPSDFALARYRPDGSLDATFAGDGRQTTDFGYDDAAAAVALDAYGRILAAGVTGPINGRRDFALARYQAATINGR